MTSMTSSYDNVRNPRHPHEPMATGNYKRFVGMENTGSGRLDPRFSILELG